MHLTSQPTFGFFSLSCLLHLTVVCSFLWHNNSTLKDSSIMHNTQLNQNTYCWETLRYVNINCKGNHLCLINLTRMTCNSFSTNEFYNFTEQSYMVSDPCDYDKASMKWKTSEHKQFIDEKNRCISHSTDPYPGKNGRQVLMFTECVSDPKSSSLRWQGWQSFTWL